MLRPELRAAGRAVPHGGRGNRPHDHRQHDRRRQGCGGRGGTRVGIIKIKTFSPFPIDALVAALGKVEAIGVVDRSVAFRWNCGPMYQETLGALYRLGRHVPAASFIGGLAGADMTVEHFHRVIRDTEALRHGRLSAGPIWLNEND